MKKALSLMTLTVIALSFAGCTWFDQTKPAADETAGPQTSESTATLEITDNEVETAESTATLEIMEPESAESTATLEIKGADDDSEAAESTATLEIIDGDSAETDADTTATLEIKEAE